MRELVREFVVADTRWRDEHDRDVRLAWHIALFERQRKLPPIDRYLAKRQRAPGAGLIGAVKTLQETYGGRLRLRRARDRRPDA